MKKGKMKRVYRIRGRNSFKGIEVFVLDRNNKISEDLIWLHFFNKKNKKEENGIVMKPDEARYIIQGLFLAIDYIIEQYKLEKFKVKNGETI